MDARENRHLWGVQYDRKLADALAVQQEIAKQISEKLRSGGRDEERVFTSERCSVSVGLDDHVFILTGMPINFRANRGVRYEYQETQSRRVQGRRSELIPRLARAVFMDR